MHLHRQRCRFEAIAPVDEQRGVQVVDFHFFQPPKCRLGDALNPRLDHLGVHREAAPQIRQTLLQRMTVAHRQPPAGDPHRLQLLDGPVAVHVADEQGQARLGIVLAQECLVKTVAAPVGGDDVEPPVVVRVNHRNPVPPATIPAEAKRIGALGELAGVVAEHPHRPPLGGQDQFSITVAIEVGLGQAVHPLDRFKRRPPGRDLRLGVVYPPEPPRRVAEKL